MKPSLEEIGKTLAETQEAIKKDCMTCLYALTHENCDNGDRWGCLGSTEESKENGGEYAYKEYVPATPKEQHDRNHNMILNGERNIVIGGQGEAEVNVKRSPEETLGNLCRVAEQCGYGVWKGEWHPHHKEIHVGISNGHYKLIYWHDEFESIERITEREWWNKIDGRV